ncbi:MAG: hypothetical protein ACUVQT_07970 [bacterium]
MKKLFLVTLVLYLGLFQTGNSQENSFDAELSALRKKIVGVCAQLQAGQPRESHEQLLGEVDWVIGEWSSLTNKYKDNPPVEYTKDPEWKNYFSEAFDNFSIMKQKIENKDYKRAAQFCGMNCALFVKIHQINGKITLTDLMFTMRQHLKMAMSMAKAGNWRDAKKNMNDARELIQVMVKLPVPTGIEKQKYLADVDLLKKSYSELNEVFSNEETDQINQQFKEFLGIFNAIYLKYL